MLDVLRGGDSARLFISSMVGRTPAAAMGLVIVLRTKELTGSFAAAGVAAGSHTLASAACSPLLGRLVDRRGQPPVLLLGALASALGLVVFATLPHGVSLLAIVPCAVVAGAALPPLGACLRTLWRPLMAPERVHAAFALESAVLEVTYIAGPVLIAGAIGAWSLGLSALVCALLLVAGTAVFATSPSSRGWRPGERVHGRGGALRAPGVRTLLVVFALIGVAFGSVEVAVAAVTDHAGAPSAAGWLLGAWGLGSLLGGLLATRAPAPADPVRRLCLTLAALALGHVLLALPVTLWALAPLLLLAGSAIAPSFGLAYGMVEGVAPAGTVTEAYTWLTTGLAAGIALGAAGAGALAEGTGPGAGFVLAASGAAGAALIAGLRRATLG